jgi:hypothetical protein
MHNTKNNTVKISLDEYLELVEFKKNVKSGTVALTTKWGSPFGFYQETQYYSESEAIEKISETNELCLQECKRMENLLSEQKMEISRIKRMPIVKFILLKFRGKL